MKRMGCGCDLGCECNKGVLGKIQAATGMNPWWFLAGAVGGVALWHVLRSSVSPSNPGQESIMPVPPKARPSDYIDLQAVANRFKQVEELYHRGDFTAEQTLVELAGLIQSANAFSVMDSAQVAQVVADIKDLQEKVKDIIQFRKDNPSIPGYVQPTPVANIAPEFQAYG